MAADTWFKGPDSDRAMAIRDRRTLLAEVARLADELAAAKVLNTGLFNKVCYLEMEEAKRRAST